MDFARAAANATMIATNKRVPASAPFNPIAAVDAMRRFEGPANGIRLNPKAVAKIITKSSGVAVVCCPFLFLPQ